MAESRDEASKRLAEDIVDAGRLLDANRNNLASARDRAQSTLAAHSVLSAFLIQFIAFSAIPALIFGGWALAVILTVSIGALAFVITTIVILVGGALLGLLGALFVAAIAAGFGTAFFISTFLFFRLISNLRASPDIRTGVQAFGNETQARISRSAPSQPASSPSTNGDWIKTEKAESEHHEHAPTYAEITQ